MTDKEVIELNGLASACRAIHEDERFEHAYRIANLVLARDVAAIAEKYAKKGQPRDVAIWLRTSCEKSLKKESENQPKPPIEL